MSASATISANVWPDPAKRRSALAGLKAIETCWPAVSSSAGSASDIAGWRRASVERSQGGSIRPGCCSTIAPSAPAFFSAAQRTAADCACALSASGTPAGLPSR